MSTSSEIDTVVDEMIQNVLGVSEEDYGDDTSFGPEGLDADSLQIVEMIETGESELDIRVPDGAIEEIETVGEVREVFAGQAD